MDPLCRPPLRWVWCLSIMRSCTWWPLLAGSLPASYSFHGFHHRRSTTLAPPDQKPETVLEVLCGGTCHRLLIFPDVDAVVPLFLALRYLQRRGSQARATVAAKAVGLFRLTRPGDAIEGRSLVDCPLHPAANNPPNCGLPTLSTIPPLQEPENRSPYVVRQGSRRPLAAQNSLGAPVATAITQSSC